MMMKQKHIAKQIGISEALLSMILSGKRSITYPLSKKLKKITKINETFWMEATPKEIKRALRLLEDV
jgi:plasmid maintenance system antidote protein VapI